MNRKGIILACCLGAFGIGVTTASASAYVQHSKTSDVVIKVKESSGLPLSATSTLDNETKKGDVNGRMVFTGVAIGKKVLTTSLDGYITAKQTIEITEQPMSLTTVILVKQPPTAHVVSLTANDWLSGTPLGDVLVKFGDQITHTDPSGNIRLEGVMAGNYQLNLSKPGYYAQMLSVTVRSSDLLMPTFKLIPEQRVLAISKGSIVSLAIDGTQRQTLSTPLGSPISLHVSPDGSHAVVLSQTEAGLRYAWAVHTVGTAIRQLGTIKPGSIPVWSDDGQKILLIGPDNIVTSFSADGTKIGQLADPTYEALFSPDGNFIASASIISDERQRSSVLAISHADGTSSKVLARHSESLSSLSFTDAGNALSYHSQNGTALQQFNVNIITSKENQVPANQLDLRPRSRSTATGLQAQINEGGNPEILAKDTSFIREIVTSGTCDPLQLPYFSSDGSILFFVTIIHGDNVLNAIPISGKTSTSIQINV